MLARMVCRIRGHDGVDRLHRDGGFLRVYRQCVRCRRILFDSPTSGLNGPLLGKRDNLLMMDDPTMER